MEFASFRRASSFNLLFAQPHLFTHTLSLSLSLSPCMYVFSLDVAPFRTITFSSTHSGGCLEVGDRKSV
eukprot:m.104803 g.104803  ORF g.104803 m.104803 type:complete len:69 (-) comp13262_c0_seq1:1031-1237(-)